MCRSAGAGTVAVMSTTDTTPGPAPAAPRTARTLRRSRTGRVGAGVAAGLGDYFGLDPVLFRVLFATSAFFGGAGVIAYAVAWVAIPEEGAGHSVVDDWIAGLRRRKVSPWAVAVVAGLVLWLAAFSWWTPAPFLPALIVIALLVVGFGRRSARASTVDGSPTVNLVKAADAAPMDAAAATTDAAGAPADPARSGDAARAWFAEARAAARERRRRAFPVRIGVLGTLAATLVVMGTVDAVHGIAIWLYFAVTGGIVLLGLIVGLVLRRAPWTVAFLLIPAAAGQFAFGHTSASLHDGIGQTEWRPTSHPAASYRLAIGQGVLDLRHLDPQTTHHTVRITMAAGQVKIVAPPALALTVQAHVHLGNVTVDGDEYNGGAGAHSHGINYNRTIEPPRGATGTTLTVVVRLADGNIAVDHR